MQHTSADPALRQGSSVRDEPTGPQRAESSDVVGARRRADRVAVVTLVAAVATEIADRLVGAPVGRE